MLHRVSEEVFVVEMEFSGFGFIQLRKPRISAENINDRLLQPLVVCAVICAHGTDDLPFDFGDVCIFIAVDSPLAGGDRSHGFMQLPVCKSIGFEDCSVVMFHEVHVCFLVCDSRSRISGASF